MPTPQYTFPYTNPLIVFVHIPKCAGTSLRNSLEAKLGIARIQPDYGWTTFGEKIQDFKRRLLHGRTPKQLVYGHFPIERYCLPGGVKNPDHFYAAYFRHPLQRILSHYHFFKRTQHPGDPIWRQMQDENWSLERFILEPRLTDLQGFLMGRFPVEQLDFAGLAERYEDGLALLGRLNPLLAGLTTVQTNLNPEKPVQKTYDVDAGLAARHEASNPRDYALYRAAVARFEALWHAAGF
jgi:hypothetical protein